MNFLLFTTTTLCESFFLDFFKRENYEIEALNLLTTFFESNLLLWRDMLIQNQLNLGCLIGPIEDNAG